MLFLSLSLSEVYLTIAISFFLFTKYAVIFLLFQDDVLKAIIIAFICINLNYAGNGYTFYSTGVISASDVYHRGREGNSIGKELNEARFDIAVD